MVFLWGFSATIFFSVPYGVEHFQGGGGGGNCLFFTGGGGGVGANDYFYRNLYNL